MSNNGALPPVFDDSHHAATLVRKIWRAVQLGPRYYLWDLPQYFAHRRARRLPLWDAAVFWNPLKEFRPREPTSWEMPPGYPQALEAFAQQGIRLALPRVRLEAMVRAWWSTRAAGGDVIECGAYQGATSLLIALLGRLNNLSQKALLLDTFTGMPAGSAYDVGRSGGEFRPPADQVEVIGRWAKALDVADRIEVHRGLFADTFPTLATRDLRFAFAHIDANIYQGTLEACAFTLPRVVPGGVVVFDDYSAVCDLGARLAIDEYLAGKGVKPQPLAACSAYLRLGSWAAS